MEPSFDLSELTGCSPDEAVERLAAEGFDVQVLPTGSMVTMDYRDDRVRVFTKDDVVDHVQHG